MIFLSLMYKSDHGHFFFFKQHGLTPLHMSCQGNHVSTSGLLIDNKAPVNAVATVRINDEVQKNVLIYLFFFLKSIRFDFFNLHLMYCKTCWLKIYYMLFFFVFVHHNNSWSKVIYSFLVTWYCKLKWVSVYDYILMDKDRVSFENRHWFKHTVMYMYM